MPAETIDQRIF